MGSTSRSWFLGEWGRGKGGVGRIDDEGSWSVDGTGCGRMLVVGMCITEFFLGGGGG